MLKKIISAWSDFVIRRRWAVIFFTALFIFVSIYPIYKTIEYQKIQAAKNTQIAQEQDTFGEDGGLDEEKEEKMERKWLSFDNSNEMWFLKDDPTLVDYNLFRERFGNNDYFVIGIEAKAGDKNIFNMETLQMIHKLSEFLENHEAITKVRSITKYQYTHSEGDSLITDNLIEDMDSLENTPETMQALSDIMAKETLAHGRSITEDLRHTVLSGRMMVVKDSIDHMVKVVNDTRAFIKDQKFEEKGFKLHLYGTPVISERFLSVSMNDFSTTFPLMLLVILVLLLFSFRSVSGTVLPFFIIIISVLGIIGTMGYLGIAFNMLSLGVPTVLIAVGVGDSIHIIVDFYHNRGNGLSSKDAAREATETLWIPCFNTSLTTCLGFFALSISDLAPLREYGIIAAVGVFMAFIFSVTTLPALLSFSKGGVKTHARISHSGWIAKVTGNLTPFTFKYSKQISLLGFLFLIIALASTSQMVSDSDFTKYFKKESQIRKDFDYFNIIYKSGGVMDIVLDSGRENGIKDPAFLNEALKFQNYLEDLEETGKASSFIAFIRNMNKAMHGDNPEYFTIPPTQEHVAQYLILYENGSPDEDLSELRTLDYRYMTISVFLKNMPSTKMKKLFDRVTFEADNRYGSLNAKLTGPYVLHINLNSYIIEGMVKSFSLAVGLIVICFFILFRSIKYGLLAMIPSLFPILFTGGVMALAGIPVNMTTMLIAAVTFGIVVDDTIHIISRYIWARKKNKTRKESLHISLTESGRAVTFTSIILIFGFSVRMWSDFIPNIHFGLFAGIIILIALFSDLVILPAIMFLTGDKKAYPVKEPVLTKSNVNLT